MNISYFSPEQIIDFCFNYSIEELEKELLKYHQKHFESSGTLSQAHLRSAINTLELIIAQKQSEEIIFAEVKCDFFEDDEGVYYIDVFMSDDENEMGKVAAKYDPKSNEIEWQSPGYKDHPQIVEEIASLKRELAIGKNLRKDAGI